MVGSSGCRTNCAGPKLLGVVDLGKEIEKKTFSFLKKRPDSVALWLDIDQVDSEGVIQIRVDCVVRRGEEREGETVASLGERLHLHAAHVFGPGDLCSRAATASIRCSVCRRKWVFLTKTAKSQFVSKNSNLSPARRGARTADCLQERSWRPWVFVKLRILTRRFS
jgi:hypothetical protein